MNNKLIAEMIGWYGTGALLLAYGLISFGNLSAESTIYQLLNLTGALGILIISLVKKVYQSAVIQVIWMSIAIIALLRMLM